VCPAYPILGVSILLHKSQFNLPTTSPPSKIPSPRPSPLPNRARLKQRPLSPDRISSAQHSAYFLSYHHTALPFPLPSPTLT
jgi:hypothetical protein